ncbi:MULTISPECIES: hypothetical protein [unclassified Methanoculleus]|uniref:Uncharacterized protein n=1 Tax=Methanoculleus palmolei TaxID=72612 RepID=A0ABD8A8J0_9EURY|nr:hypothetical protein R6Y95_05410 [Methanoculleus palmolei]
MAAIPENSLAGGLIDAVATVTADPGTMNRRPPAHADRRGGARAEGSAGPTRRS